MAIADGELVAVMVLDTVGSTARRAQLGEVAANQLDLAERAALRTRIADVGGEVVAETGDGAVALFPSASAALEVGLSLRGPQYRIGVAVGEVVHVEDGVWSGSAMQEAAMLERACPVGEVVASPLAAQLATSVHVSIEPLDSAPDLAAVVRPSAL